MEGNGREEKRTEEKGKVVIDLKDQSGASSPAIMCPACKFLHVFRGWTFNGDYYKPTFSPSMLVNKNRLSTNAPVCHSFVTDGQIRFLGDCTHEMKNKTVPLEEF